MLVFVVCHAFCEWRRDRAGMRRRYEREALGRRPRSIGKDVHCLYWFRVGDETVGVNNNELRNLFVGNFEQVVDAEKKA